MCKDVDTRQRERGNVSPDMLLNKGTEESKWPHDCFSLLLLILYHLYLAAARWPRRKDLDVFEDAPGFEDTCC